MTTRLSRDRGALALAAIALVACVAGWSAPAAAQGQIVEPTRLDRYYCGTVITSRLPPRTYLSVDLDGDGQLEHFVATWGGVEQLRQQEGSVPPVFVHEATVYSSTVNTQYSCADLVALDVNHDGHLDLVYGSHRELVVLEYRNGRFVVGRREPVALPFDADPRIELVEGRLQVADFRTRS